jgi:hypothetical protein
MQITCAGCRYNQGGRCRDLTVWGKDGGDLPTDFLPRRCYEPLQTLSEGLTLYLVDLIRKQEKGQKAKG